MDGHLVKHRLDRTGRRQPAPELAERHRLWKSNTLNNNALRLMLFAQPAMVVITEKLDERHRQQNNRR
jgi:hypothetical protein